MAYTSVISSLDNSFGSLFIGLIVSSALWGVGCTQCYWWYLMYPKDSQHLKLLVVLTWMFDTVHQAVISHILYFYLVQNYYNPPGLDIHIWSLQLQTLFEALTCVCVQGFFVHRIWTLSRRNHLLASIPTIFVLANFALAVVYVSRAFTIHSIHHARITLRPESAAINGLASASDIAIAFMMVLLLSRKRTGWKHSDRVLTRLMIYTVHTGLITSVAAMATLVLSLALPKTTIFGAVYFVTGKLYLNTMVASLNARKQLAVLNRSTASAEVDGQYINVTKAEVTVIDGPVGTAHQNIDPEAAVDIDDERGVEVDSEGEACAGVGR